MITSPEFPIQVPKELQPIIGKLSVCRVFDEGIMKQLLEQDFSPSLPSQLVDAGLVERNDSKKNYRVPKPLRQATTSFNIINDTGNYIADNLVVKHYLDGCIGHEKTAEETIGHVIEALYHELQTLIAPEGVPQEYIKERLQKNAQRYIADCQNLPPNIMDIIRQDPDLASYF